PHGTAISGVVLGSPLLRPVVVTNSTGSPASTSGALVRPLLSRRTTRSTGISVLENAHAPPLVLPRRCMLLRNAPGALCSYPRSAATPMVGTLRLTSDVGAGADDLPAHVRSRRRPPHDPAQVAAIRPRGPDRREPKANRRQQRTES